MAGRPERSTALAPARFAEAMASEADEAEENPRPPSPPPASTLTALPELTMSPAALPAPPKLQILPFPPLLLLLLLK